MNRTTARAGRRSRAASAAILAGLAALAMTGLTSVEPAAAVAPPAGLSITLSDATTQTESGAILTYTAAVTNAGASAVKGTLQVTVPGYASYAHSASGKKTGSDLSWPITVGAGKTVSRETTVRVGRIPRGEVRFTTLATLYPEGEPGRILVRTADPDGIRGVVDPAHSVRSPGASAGQSNAPLVITAIIGGAIIVVALAVLLWIRGRRRARARSAT
ncbi:hypothetical protein [Pseudolysinimonas kribbensis]